MKAEKTTLTQQDKLNILTRDFLERDGDTFIRVRRTDRLGWESTIPADGAYSAAVTDAATKEDALKEAYRLACDMITVMDFKDKVTVKICPNESCTNGRSVYVATKVFDEPGMTLGKQLDAFLGFAIHEGCHLLYTDFKAFDKDSTVNQLCNIIEDERIERQCGEDKPGLANFLGASKYYAFDKYQKRVAAEGGFDNLTDTQRFMNCILAYVRYPKALSVNDLTQFADQMLEVKDILTPYPQSSAEALTAARRIRDLMKKFHDEEQKKEQEKQQQGGSGEGEDNQQQSQSSSQNDSKQDQEQEKQQPSSPQDGQEKKSGSNDSTSSFEKEMRDMEEAIEELQKDCSAGLTESDCSQEVLKDGGKGGKVCEGELERGSRNGTYIEKAKDNKDKYQESLDRVRRYIPAISKSLRCQSTEQKLCFRGMRSGTLDTNKLAEAYQGVQTVYVREGSMKCTKVSVCILIDESGSMWGQGESAARDTAVLLNEALAKVPNVDLYIYGHTASMTTDLFVYRERGFNRKYALGSTDSRLGNHDSIAIREAAARVRKHTDEKCLLFVISDGAPNEGCGQVRNAVKDVEKDGFNVVAISIDPYYDPSTMYDHNVNLTDMNTLAIDLGKMVKQAITRNTRRTVTTY